MGVSGSNLTVINAGTISVGGSGDGASAQANAVTFTGGTNTFQIQAGSVVNGNVVGAGSDTLQLGGATSGTFSASVIGTQYSGFSTFTKEGTSTFTVTDAPTVATAWTVNGGALAVSGSANSGALGTGTVTLNAGTALNLSNVTIANTIAANGDPTINVTGASGTGALTGSGTYNVLGTSGSAATDKLTIGAAAAARAHCLSATALPAMP